MARALALIPVALVALVLTAGEALAAPIPGPVEAMIDAAASDPVKLKVVSDVAKQTNPDSVAEIDAKLAGLKAEAEARRVAKLSNQGLLEGWSGQGQAGGFISSGNTEETGLVLGMDLKKESLSWRHRINALVDYKTSNSIQTRERYFVGYEGDYKINDRLYTNLLLSWEKDPFAGFEHRFSESVGLGYSLIKTPTMKLDVDAGLAARQTRLVIGGDENSYGGRAGARYEWKLTPTTIFSEVASGYFDDSGNTLESTTAITTKLSGALSGRASFNVRYESDPPPARETTDTTTRFSLVYSF